MSRRHSCPREGEVLDLVAIGQWPARADDALAAHVTTCEICGDLARVAIAIGGTTEDTWRAISVPDASTIWYRAEARGRQDKARQAARPLTLVVGTATLSLFAVVLAASYVLRASIADWWRGVSLPDAAFLTDIDRILSRADLPSSWTWAAAGVLLWVAAIPLVFLLARVVDRDDRRPSARAPRVTDGVPIR